MSAEVQASSLGGSQACAMQRDGKHRWQETEDRTALVCSRCGFFAPPCHSETGRHQWHQYKGRGRRACCGGYDGAVNRRIACSLCDERKADQLPWEFMPERFSPSDVPRHAWRERIIPTDVQMIKAFVHEPL